MVERGNESLGKTYNFEIIYLLVIINKLVFYS